uniref:(northern house mosquito) hypothetical protein n=1 Tax=Culex pipiens TaxID=7175 RepID=A0A8D8K339_CULPI
MQLSKYRSPPLFQILHPNRKKNFDLLAGPVSVNHFLTSYTSDARSRPRVPAPIQRKVEGGKSLRNLNTRILTNISIICLLWTEVAARRRLTRDPRGIVENILLVRENPENQQRVSGKTFISLL